MIGIRTIKTGQRLAIWNRQGAVRLVDGPARLWLWQQTAQELTQHIAREGEYLIITYQDGRVEHLPGPVMRWQHPVEHREVVLAQAITISAQEAVVVYGRDGDRIQRRIVLDRPSSCPAAGSGCTTSVGMERTPRTLRAKSPRRCNSNACG